MLIKLNFYMNKLLRYIQIFFCNFNPFEFEIVEMKILLKNL